MHVRHMDESQRRHGFTTLQMKHAPHGALFIWPVSGSLDYARALAIEHGREDLEIVSPSILDKRAERLRGRRLSGIVLDHACEPTTEEYDLLRELRTHVVK